LNVIRWADGCEPLQIPPAVPAVKLTRLGKQPFPTQSFEERAGRILRCAKQDHRADTLSQKPTGNVSNESLSQAKALVLTKQVDLAQFARIAR